MTRKIRAALFDLDGVVVLTDKYHYLAWKSLADKCGWRFDEAVNHRLRGVPRMRSLEIILGHNGLSLSELEKASLADEKNSRYTAMLNEIGEDDLYPHVVHFIKNLRAKGLKTALCSSSRNARLVLEKLALAPLFDAVVAGDDILNGKPDPEIFLRAAELTRTPPALCVVFEDAALGIEAAIRAGMRHVGIGSPDSLPNAIHTATDYRSIDIDALAAWE